MRVAARGLVCAVLLSFAAALSAGEKPTREGQGPGLFDAQGMRAARYRAPTPGSGPGGVTLGTEALLELMQRDDPVLIYVQAVALRPETAEFGVSWLPNRPRHSLPGAVWLPNVGYAGLDPRMEEYFRRNLLRLTGGDLARPTVIFCVQDCWMSWNAVRRAAALGYRRLYWYPAGTDGWHRAGLPTAVLEPVPLDAQEMSAGRAVGSNVSTDR